MTKPNGRPHGGARAGSGPKLSPWKTRGAIQEILRRHRIHQDEGDVITPLEHWFCILNDPEQPEKRRDWASECLASYTVAKPKPIDSEGSSDNKVTIVIEHDNSIPTTIMGSQVVVPQITTITDEDE